MSHITLTNETSRQLAAVQDRVELRDEDGRLLGIFEPGVSESDLKSFDQLSQQGYTGSFSEFIQGVLEVRRAIRDPNYAKDWKTTEQIMAKLKSLP